MIEPTWDGRVSLNWAGEERVFRLGIGELRALEAECGAGYLEIWRQLSEQTCRIDTVAKVIRYGLEGEGVEANEAARLVTRYALRPPFADNLETAQTIYGAALYLPEDLAQGKAEGDGTTARTDSPSPE